MDEHRTLPVIIIITLLCGLTEPNIGREFCECMRLACYKGIVEGKPNSGNNYLCFYSEKIIILDLYLYSEPLKLLEEGAWSIECGKKEKKKKAVRDDHLLRALRIGGIF